MIERLGPELLGAEGPLGGSHASSGTRKGIVLVIGNLDGVHKGHQAVVAHAVREARARNLAAALLTFDPHPSMILGGVAPPVLTTLDRKAELVGRLGIERTIARTFDPEFAAWPPDRFARRLVHETLGAKLVIVGENFRFGAQRAGDLACLQAIGAEVGFEVHALPMMRDAKGWLSSTRVRDALAAGDLADAEGTLRRPHALSGVVVHGEKRGRSLGFPTANLGNVEELIPPDGVFAVALDALETEGAAHAVGLGVMNVGVRPTLGGALARTIEVHVFDWEGDLYGRRVRVHLIARLRNETKFDGLPALKAQIQKDVEAARARLASLAPHGAAYG